MEKEAGSLGADCSNLRVPWDALGEMGPPSWSASGTGAIASQTKELEGAITHPCPPANAQRHLLTAANPDRLFPALYSRIHILVLWCTCPSETNWHWPRAEEPPPEGLCGSVLHWFLKFGVVKLSQPAREGKQVHWPAGWAGGLDTDRGRQVSESTWVTRGGDCSLFWEGFWDTGKYEPPLWGQKEGQCH